jgi:hypothetical protein
MMNRPAFLTFTQLFMMGARKPKEEAVTFEIQQITKVTEYEVGYYDGPDVVDVPACKLHLGKSDYVIVEGSVAETQRALVEASLRTNEDPQLERIATSLEQIANDLANALIGLDALALERLKETR